MRSRLCHDQVFAVIDKESPAPRDGTGLSECAREDRTHIEERRATGQASLVSARAAIRDFADVSQNQPAKWQDSPLASRPRAGVAGGGHYIGGKGSLHKGSHYEKHARAITISKHHRAG
jgi:hypothetical protein